MEIVSTVPPRKTKEKKYMYVCRTCQKGEGGFNYSKTSFIADYPSDFHVGLSTEYCCCPVCGSLHFKNVWARLRYLLYEWNKEENKLRG